MFSRTARLALLLAGTLATGCGEGDGTSRRTNPVGPGMGPGPMGPMGGGTAGPGMAAAVASEFDYLVRMIPHHEEAIATAALLERGTARPDVRAFAASIVRTQTVEVAQMQAWLAEWYPGRDARVAYEPMMRDLSALAGDALDRAFFEDMIPHHMMAIMMSQQLILRDLAVHPAVLPFAATIRDTQRDEIRIMAEWLSE